MSGREERPPWKDDWEPEGPRSAGSSWRTFFSAAGIAFGTGAFTVFLAFLTTRIGTRGLSLTLALWNFAPILVWILPFRARTQSPEVPSKASGAIVGAALFTGLWLLYVRALFRSL